MKTILLAAAFVLCAATSAQAQNTTASAAKHEHVAATATDPHADAAAKGKAMASMLTTELGLDEKQAMRVEKLLTTTEQRAIGLDAKGEKGKASMEKLSESAYAGVKDMLTPEQAKKLEGLKSAGKWTVACASPSGKGCCAGGHAAEAGKPACCQGKGAKAEATPAESK